MKNLKMLVEKGKDFKILKFRNLEIVDYEIAFDVLKRIDKIINGNFLSLDEGDFKTFKEDDGIDLVLGTQGYSAQFFKDKQVLKLVFIEGGLE